jgi:hypothetical protein
MGVIMMNRFKYALAATALASLAAPAMAQDEPEEARTSYQVTFMKFADGAGERWLEIMNDHFVPARQAAGLPVPTVHWMMDGPWDLLVVTELPDGMAALDSHNPEARVRYDAAILAQEGSDEAVTALTEEMQGLIADSQRYYTHTHP